VRSSVPADARVENPCYDEDVKLRIRGNSIRLRLGQSEVQRLNEGQRVEEQTQFGPASKLTYAIEPTARDDISADFANNKVIVRVPRGAIADWATSDQVGINSQQGELKILIEKDFECSDPTESQADAFPNPNKCR
jgi:hypothetical protein